MTAGPARAGDDFSSLFDDELVPVIRRLGERRPGAAGPVSDDDTAARLAVWQGLAGLGALRLALPGGDGGQRAIAPLAELMGNALYQSPFFDTVMAAEVIAATAPGRRDQLLDAIGTGEITVAMAAREDPAADLRRPAPVDVAPGTGRVSGYRRFVAFAPDVDYLLVVGRLDPVREAGITAVLVPSRQPGVAIRRHDDIGRGEVFAVRLTEASVLPGGPGTDGAADPAMGWPALWRQVLARAQLRHACYLTGMCHGAIQLSSDYARQRHVFGQALAKFQAPVFRLAALAARLEAVRALAYQACSDADAGEDVALPACQALLLAGELATETGAEAVQLHGSYGLTDGCDAQLFYRRAVGDAMLLGSGRQLRRQAADLLRRQAAQVRTSDGRAGQHAEGTTHAYS